MVIWINLIEIEEKPKNDLFGLRQRIHKMHGALRKLHSNEVNELGNKIRQRLLNPGGKSLPVFLVGCGRSGTSMLVRQLSKSWQVELYNEDHPAAFSNFSLKDLDAVDSLIAKSYAPITLFKPILDTYRAHFLLERFAAAKLIFAFRHYEDVVNSILRMKRWKRTRLSIIQSWIDDDFAEFSAAPVPEATKEAIRSRWSPSLNVESGAALYWLFFNRLYFDLGLCKSARVKLINYEAVVLHPKKEINSLCEFLGVNFGVVMIEGIHSSSVKRNPSPLIEPQILEDCQMLWQDLSNMTIGK